MRSSAIINAPSGPIPTEAGSLECRFLFGDADIDDVLRDALTADMRSARLSATFRAYYLLRRLIPQRLRQTLQQLRRGEPPARWYFADAQAKALFGRIRNTDDCIMTIHPWPDGTDFAFVLTHDIETADGMRRVAKIADLEEELGFRSSWNIVPYKYPIDRGLINDLQKRGFEIGIHGYNHDGKLFTSRTTFDQRVPAINAALKSFDAVGFRAPMVHRNLVWLQSLEVDYDASCFDVDPFQAMPGGIGGLWPFVAGRFVELPYTLPQDHTLFIVLGEHDGSIWRQKLDYVANLSGMALVITHPDYLDTNDRVEIYRQFLCEARNRAGMWHALPRDVAMWWRQRDESTLERDSCTSWAIRGRAAGRGRVATIRSIIEPTSTRTAPLDTSQFVHV